MKAYSPELAKFLKFLGHFFPKLWQAKLKFGICQENFVYFLLYSGANGYICHIFLVWGQFLMENLDLEIRQEFLAFFVFLPGHIKPISVKSASCALEKKGARNCVLQS